MQALVKVIGLKTTILSRYNIDGKIWCDQRQGYYLTASHHFIDQLLKELERLEASIKAKEDEDESSSDTDSDDEPSKGMHIIHHPT